MTLIIISLALVFVTFLGGFFAFRFRDNMHLVLGLSAGLIFGLAFFDLLPEAIELLPEYEVSKVLMFLVLGFLGYMIIDRSVGVHKEDNLCEHEHDHKNVKKVSILNFDKNSLRLFSISFHSFIDGLGIGFAFQVSEALGLVFALAVIGHRFSDGINVVSLLGKIKDIKNSSKIYFALAFNSMAAVFGIILGGFYQVKESVLGIILAVFSGVFIYLAASELIPESYHSHPVKKTTLMTILGVVFIYFIIEIAHH